MAFDGDNSDDELDNLIAEAERRHQEWYENIAPPPPRPRRYIERSREEAHARLFADYFAPQPRWEDDVFRRRFRMRRPLFLRIAETLAARDPYFEQRPDALGREGLSTLLKCTSAIRQLATGMSSDVFDEYLHVAESTGRESMKRFCIGVREAFGAEYLRRPTTYDCQQLLHLHEERHGFPGMLGSIDCMHWQWKNCPNAWRGTYTSGHKGTHPTMVLEAVADYRLWIWHAFFGVPGSNNDINVLNNSPVFNDVLNGRAPAISFEANNRIYKMGYYLADGIYPRWPTFVKTLNLPQDPKRILFAQKQESARKDVERAFGVLQARFAVVKQPGRAWYASTLADIIYACIIMHNMIIEDEGPAAGNWIGEDHPGSSHASEPPTQGAPPPFRVYLERRAEVRDSRAHTRLQEDLIEHIWAKFGNNR